MRLGQSVISYFLCASPCPLLCDASSLLFIYVHRQFLFYSAMEFVGPIATDRTQVDNFDETQTERRCVTRPNQSGSGTESTRVHLERMNRFLRVLTVCEGKSFWVPPSPHPLLSPAPPQILIPFNNIQLLTNTNSLSLYRIDFALVIQKANLDIWCTMDFVTS